MTEWGYSKEELSASLCGAAVGYLSVTQECDDELYVNACKIVESIKGIPTELTSRQKVGLIAWKISRKLFYFICIVTGRLKIRNYSKNKIWV